MDLKSTQEELAAAYEKLGETEDKLARANAGLSKQYKVEEILIAAGFLTREKIREAESVLDAL